MQQYIQIALQYLPHGLSALALVGTILHWFKARKEARAMWAALAEIPNRLVLLKKEVEGHEAIESKIAEFTLRAKQRESQEEAHALHHKRQVEEIAKAVSEFKKQRIATIQVQIDALLQEIEALKK